MSKVKVMIVDDHQMVRDGFVSILGSDERYQVVGEANNGLEALSKIKDMKEKPDVVLMDINMPEMDGMICTENLREKYPEVKVIVLTMVKQSSYIKKMLKAGALGYILKNSNRKELFKAIDSVSNGQTFFSQAVSEEVMGEMSRLKKENKNTGDIALSVREKEVLELITKDMSNKQIADKLFISIRTVESHKQHLLSKTNTQSVAGLVVYAFKHNLVVLDPDR